MTDVANIRIVVDTRDIKSANEELEGLGKKGEGAGQKTKDGVDKATKAVDLLKKAFIALGAYMGVRQIADYADAWASAANRLRVVGVESDKLAATQSALLGIANDTRASYTSTVDLYSKLTQASKSLGLSQQELADLTKTINQGFIVSGASASEMDGAIRQLAQGLAAGALRGDEFNSIAEQAPAIMNAIADSLQMTNGQLRTFAATGGITAEIVVNAMKGAAESIDEAFGRTIPTLAQSMTVAKNNVMAFVGESNTIKLAMGAAGASIILLSENLDVLVTAFQMAGAAMLVVFHKQIIVAVIAGLASLNVAVVASYKLIMAHPFIAVGAAVAALAVLIYKNWDAVKTATERLWIEIRLSWESFKINFLIGFGMFINGLISGWESMKNIAIAAFAGIAAAAKDPLNPLDSFRNKFKQTMDDLQRNTKPVVVFSDAIYESRQTVFALGNQLVELNRRTSDTERLAEDGADAIEELGEAAGETGTQFENMADYVKEYNEQAKKAEESTRSVIEKIREERDALGLSGLQLEIHNRLRSLAVGATEEMRQAVIDETTALYNAQEAHRDQEKSLELLTQGYEKITTSISGFFYDLFTNGKSAFDSLVDAFMDMLARIAAAWAASNVMSFLTGGQIPGMSIGQAASSVLGQGVMSAGKAILAGATGSAAAGTTAAAGAFGPLASGYVAAGAAGAPLLSGAALPGAAPAVAPAGGGLLSGIGSSLAAGAKAVWGGITNIASMIPGWGWALGGIGLAASLLDKGGTMSGNNGFLTAPVPGISSDQYQAGAPFASGYEPLIFNRRGSVEDATAVTDGFRAVDSAIVGLFRAGGIELRVNPGEIAGYDENGTGRGVFFGAATEDGDATGTSLDDQLTSYARQMFLIASGKGLLPDQYLNPILAAGSYDQMIQKAVEMAAAEGILVDGSHAEGLKKVPRDGYVAELHAGERVLTMEQAIAADSMAQDISMLKGSLEEIMFAVAKNTNKLWRINDRWDKDGMPPVRS